MKRGRPFAAALLLAGAALFPLGAFAAPGYVDGSTEMHAGPDYDYPTVAVVDDDAAVEVYGCLEDWSWCDVSYYDDRGWISGDHLASVYEGERRPIAYVAPYIGLGILAFSVDNYWNSYYSGRPWYRDRARWFGWSREHHRSAWEGRHAGWDHRGPDRNWGGNERNDRHDDHDRGNWRGNDHRQDNDRRAEIERRTNEQNRNDDANRNGFVGGTNRGGTHTWSPDATRQRDVQHEAAVEQNRQREARGDVPRADNRHDWGQAMSAGRERDRAAQQAAQNAAPRPVPHAQPQPQPQRQGGEHGGDRGGDHGNRGDRGDRGQGHGDKD